MKKIFLLISIIASIFVTLEYKNISLLLAHGVGDMRYYVWGDDGIREYNTAQYLIAEKNYTGAKSVLSPLLNQWDITLPWETWETYGDLVYEIGGATGDVVVFYRRALEYTDHPRIHDKIALLDSLPPRTWESENTKAQSGSSDSPASTSGATLREMRRTELEDETRNRAQSVDLQSGYTRPDDIISRTLDLLATWSTAVRDW